MLRPDRWGLQFYFLVLTFLSPPMLWGVKESSLRAGKWISSCSQSLRLPSVGCLVGAAAWLDRRGRLKNKIKNPFFLEAEGFTHSLLDAIFDRMLSTRLSLPYRRRHCGHF